MMRWLVLTLLPLASCHVCTLMYVPDGVGITFDARSGWSTGVYRVEAEGRIFEVALPISANDSHRIGPADGGTSGLSALVVDATGTALESLFLDRDTPQTLQVSVSVNGAELTRQTLTPTYSQSEPNGVGCGVTRSGSARLEF